MFTGYRLNYRLCAAYCLFNSCIYQSLE